MWSACEGESLPVVEKVLRFDFVGASVEDLISCLVHSGKVNDRMAERGEAIATGDR